MNILQFVLDRTFIKNSFPFRVILLSGLQCIMQFKSSGGNFFLIFFFKLLFTSILEEPNDPQRAQKAEF